MSSKFWSGGGGVLILLALAPLLGACATTGGGSVAGGECKFLERPVYAVRGVRQYDQDWIDRTVEGGVGACGWQRPAARPAEMNTPAARAKSVAKKQPKPKKTLLRRVHDAMLPKPKPVVAAPEAPAPSLTVLPAEPAAPAPRSVIDELLSPTPWAR